MTDRAHDILAARLEALAAEADHGDWPDVCRRADRLAAARRRLPQPKLVAAFAAALAAIAAIATPALGLHEPIVRFFESEPAAESVKQSFATLDQGAPIPQWRTGVIAGETRNVMKAYFADKWHTLSVAPTKYGGLCEAWSDVGGGCDRLGTVPLSVSWGASRPFRFEDPLRPRFEETPIDYLTGFAHSRWVHAVEIRFEDGEVVRPRVVWVGEPIDAGFFAYGIPKEHLREGHRIAAVVALDDDGEVVTQQSRSPGVRIGAPQPDALVDEKERVLEITTSRGIATIWRAPTRYEGTCVWLELAGETIGLDRCAPKGYEHDGGIATRFLPTRGTVLLYASVSPSVAWIEVLHADGVRARLIPRHGYALYEVPGAHDPEGDRASEIVFRDREGDEITRIDVSR